MRLEILLFITLVNIQSQALLGLQSLCLNVIRSLRFQTVLKNTLAPNFSLFNKFRKPLFANLNGRNEFNYPFDDDDNIEGHKDGSLPPIHETSQRRSRKERQRLLRERFLTGNDLIDLREKIKNKEKELFNLLRLKNVQSRINELRREIRDLQSHDAEFIYAFARKQIGEATSNDEIEKWNQVALDARSCISHFNLEGLWVGKYGPHGYEMINVTYVGDSIVAYKVTGDQNVPSGEISFKADLKPAYHPSTSVVSSNVASSSQEFNNNLEPIQLTEAAAKQWGVKQLFRFTGLGQVAAKNFTRNEWIDGQLIVVSENYFSFAWVPIGYQIFFGRPEPELILKMLREEERRKNELLGTNDNDVDTMRESAYGSLDETMVSMVNDERAHMDTNIIFEEGSFQ